MFKLPVFKVEVKDYKENEIEKDFYFHITANSYSQLIKCLASFDINHGKNCQITHLEDIDAKEEIPDLEVKGDINWAIHYEFPDKDDEEISENEAAQDAAMKSLSEMEILVGDLVLKPESLEGLAEIIKFIKKDTQTPN